MITKLLTRIEEDVSNDEHNCDKLCEMLSVLSTKEESLMDLDKGIKDETLMEGLEEEITALRSTRTVFSHGRLALPGSYRWHRRLRERR